MRFDVLRKIATMMDPVSNWSVDIGHLEDPNTASNEISEDVTESGHF
jgi:hypothetical protein